MGWVEIMLSHPLCDSLPENRTENGAPVFALKDATRKLMCTGRGGRL
jgi:hypothetical protein